MFLHLPDRQLDALCKGLLAKAQFEPPGAHSAPDSAINANFRERTIEALAALRLAAFHIA